MVAVVGYGDGQKAIGLDWQNNNSARESRFFVRFFAVVARLPRETFLFHVLLGREHAKTTYVFFFGI